MASITARRSVLRGRPPALAGGRRGAITAHSRSVMSLGYRADKRLWSWRVVSSQAISSSASRPGGGNHSSLILLKFTGRRSGLWAWRGLSDGVGQASTVARDRTAAVAGKRAAAD